MNKLGLQESKAKREKTATEKSSYELLIRPSPSFKKNIEGERKRINNIIRKMSINAKDK